MAQQNGKTIRPTVPRWLKALLAVSLAVNLLVAGAIVGAILRHGGVPGAHPALPSLGVAMYRELPVQDRRALREETRHTHAKDPANRRAEVRALAEVLRADPFDPSRVAEILDAQAERRHAFRKDMQAAWLRRVSAMPDAARRAYADRLEAAMAAPGHGERRWRRRGSDSGHPAQPDDR